MTTRPWRPIEADGRRCYARLRLAGGASLSARVTDLCDWWSCELDRAEIERQVRENSIQTPPEELLPKIMQCFEEDARMNGVYSIILTIDDAGAALLTVDLHELFDLSFRCVKASEADRAVCVRDELLLPSLLALEQMEQLVAPSVAWEPPPPNGGSATPSFGRPLLQRIFRWAAAQCTSALAAGGTAHHPETDTTAAASAVLGVGVQPPSAVPDPAAAECEVREKRKRELDAQREEKARKHAEKHAKK